MNEIEFVVSKDDESGLWHVKHRSTGLIVWSSPSRVIAELDQRVFNNRSWFPKWDAIRKWPVNTRED